MSSHESSASRYLTPSSVLTDCSVTPPIDAGASLASRSTMRDFDTGCDEAQVVPGVVRRPGLLEQVVDQFAQRCPGRSHHLDQQQRHQHPVALGDVALEAIPPDFLAPDEHVALSM